MRVLPAQDTISLTRRLKLEAQRLGFEEVGVCAAVTPTGITHFAEWLAAGFAGEMHYLSDRREAYNHPRHVLAGARSIVMLAANYHSPVTAEVAPGFGRVARYAEGSDYHEVLRGKLATLVEWVKREIPAAQARGVVDTAPLLEREFAQLAGVGWVGKNTMLLTRGLGSYFFLAALLVDVELSYDDETTVDHCGTCRACLDACPTQAFVAPYQLDSRRCISYLTIELKGSIPEPLREGMGDWLFGCDICQEVCPWNRHAAMTVGSNFSERGTGDAVELAPLFALSDAQFREQFRATPLWRAKRRGVLRNAAIVLGNQRDESSMSALILGLNDAEPVVRCACAWALSRLTHETARSVLRQRAEFETDQDVLKEIEFGLAAAAPRVG